MECRERDLFLTHAKTETRSRGRNCLAGLRLTLKIFARPEPSARIRDAANTGFEEIDIEQRMSSRAVEFSAFRGLLIPDQDMAKFFSAELEKGRISRPPFAPYVVEDTLAAQPWLPADETHGRALERWHTAQRVFRRHAGNRDFPLGQYVLRRLRFVLACDLTGVWAEFGGIAAQFDHIAVVLGLSISDHAGIAATYDFRMRRAVQKLAKNRPTRADYFEFLSNISKDIRAEILRDFEARSDEMKKEKEMAVKEKATKKKQIRTRPRRRRSGRAGGNGSGHRMTGRNGTRNAPKPRRARPMARPKSTQHRKRSSTRIRSNPNARRESGRFPKQPFRPCQTTVLNTRIRRINTFDHGCFQKWPNSVMRPI